MARSIDFTVGVVAFFAAMVAFGALWGHQRDGTGIVILAAATTFVVYFIYEVVLVGFWGRTLGKVLLRIRVVRAQDERQPGIRRALLRNLIPTVTLLLFFPAYPLAWMAELLGRHSWPNDRLAGTRVVLS